MQRHEGKGVSLRLIDGRQENECQQKLLHFSSQNLVNVAWAFAKAVPRAFHRDPFRSEMLPS